MADNWEKAPETLHLGENTLHLWQAKLSSKETVSEPFRKFLSPEEIIRADRFIFEKDRARFAHCRGILRIILGRYLHLDPQEVPFEYSEYGKPHLGNPFKNALEFNISHSGEKALFGFILKGRLGVDLEYMEKERDYQAIAPRFFSKQEASFLSQHPESEQKQIFSKIWVLKEAFIKGLSQGLTFPLDGFHVGWESPHEPKFMGIPHAPEEEGKWDLRFIDLGPEYQAAYAISPSAPQVYQFQWTGRE